METGDRLAGRRPVDERARGGGLAAHRPETPGRRGGQVRVPRDERRGVRILPDRSGRAGDLRPAGRARQALLRPTGPGAPLPGDQRDLRLHDRARLGALPERSRRRQWAVRDELGLCRRPGHRRSPRVLQVHGQIDRREAWPPRHLHAEAVLAADRQRLPRARLHVGSGRAAQPVPGQEGRAGIVQTRLPLPRRHPAARAGNCAPSSIRPSTATSASTPHRPPPAQPGPRTR